MQSGSVVYFYLEQIGLDRNQGPGPISTLRLLGLGYWLLKPENRVQIPEGVPNFNMENISCCWKKRRRLQSRPLRLGHL